MLNVLSLKDAQSKVKDNIKFLEVETISLDQANNHILAVDIFCKDNIPQFKRSTMDGYAVRSNATFGASQTVPAMFKLVGEIKMGVYNNIDVPNDSCVYVPTGGMVPEDCDAVVMIEHTNKMDNDILVYSPAKPNENIINIGEDLKQGELILSKGALLNSSKIGILAGAGITSVPVYKQIRYSIISTGDEIIPIENELKECQIRDINSYSIDSKLSLYGYCVKKYLIKDDLHALHNALNEAINNSDIVLISGGSSVGIRDYTLKAIEEETKDILFHGIALKPGKPTMVAKKDNKFIIGLPGHPMAALVSLELIFIDPLKNVMNCKHNNYIYAKAAINFPSASGRATIMPVKLERKEDGLYASPMFYKSGLINILAQADGYIVINDFEEGINKDTLLEVRPL